MILSNADSLYLDCGFPGLQNPRNWCTRMVGWDTMYDEVMNPRYLTTQNKTDSFSLFKKYEKLLLGAEACSWGEQVSWDSAHVRVWPRLLGLAERLWTNAVNTRSKAAWDRVNWPVHRMNVRGVRGDFGQPMWCWLNPGQCYDLPLRRKAQGDEGSSVW